MNNKRWAAVAGAAIAIAVTLTVVLTAWFPDSGSPSASARDDDVGHDRPPKPPRVSAQQRVELQRQLNDVVARGSSGAVAELVERNGGGQDTWNGVAGVADRSTNVPVDPEAHFRIASLSKVFVAATVLKLAGEDRLRLDDTVEELLPGVVEGGERITVRMLLSHTSGLYSYNHDMPSVLDDPHRVWRPEELVKVANKHDPVFAPGTDVQYSNTNYVLAAMVIEKVTGHPYNQAVTDRVIRPLKLTETSIPDTSAVPKPFMRAYLAIPPGPGEEPRPRDITAFNPTRWYGTAQVVSTVSDINRFWSALLDGKVVDQRMLGEMLEVQGTTDNGYGFALGPRRYTLTCGVRVWMHSGNIPGYRTWTVHSEHRHFTLFQARYEKNPDPPAWAMIETAMCPRGATGDRPRATPTDHPTEAVEGTGRDDDGG